MPADVDHGGQIACRQREARINGLRPRFEQLDRAGSFGSLCVGDIGNRKTSQPIDVLVGGPERLLARYENAHLRGTSGKRVDERRHGVRQVFAIVQHQEGSRGSELHLQRARSRRLAAHAHSDCLCYGGGHECAIGERCELHPPDAIRIVGLCRELLRYRLGDASLADAACARDRDHRMLAE